MLDLFIRPTVWPALLALLSYLVYRLTSIPSNLPKGLPIVGAKDGDWFPLLQAAWRNTKDNKTALRSAYELYKDRPSILPSIDYGNMVLLPVSHIKFVAEQPTDVLSMHESAEHQLQFEHTVMDQDAVHEPLHIDLVAVLTREIGSVIAPVRDEIEHCFGKIWGSSERYHEVQVLKTMQEVISGVTNRVFVGLPLCRNQEVLDMAIAFAQDIPLSSMILRIFPSWMRPVVAPLITIPNRRHTSKFIQLLSPEIDARLAKYDAKAASNSDSNSNIKDKQDEDEPNDCLQWAIVQAKRSGNPKNWTKSVLAHRVLLLNFAAIHTSSFAISHALFDLAAAPPGTIDILRREITDVLAQHDGVWSKISLAQLRKLDSVMRESQRKNSFVAVSVNRKVVPPEGVTFPCGVHVAKGVTVASAGYSIHQDPEIYENPKAFEPFRFAQSGESESESERTPFTSTSKTFIAWGLGRNACPGRFFASNEIKLMLAYILMNYDIEPMEQRPHNTWIGGNRIPPTEATIRIKKRVD